MAIIAIARECGAYGENVAKKLSEELGYRYIDKAIVEARLESMGLTPKHRLAYDEKKPGFFAAFSSAMEDYMRCLKTLAYEEAAKGDCVFLGRGCQFLFKDVPNAVKIRLIAPFDIRVKRISESLGIDERAARLEVNGRDKDRSEFNMHFYDTAWSDASNYDMVINTAVLSPSSVVQIVKEMLKQKVTEEAIQKGEKMLKDLALGQIVERFLINELKMPVYFLEAICDDGVVTLNGIARSGEYQIKAGKAAMEVTGVKRVISNITIGR